MKQFVTDCPIPDGEWQDQFYVSSSFNETSTQSVNSNPNTDTVQLFETIAPVI